MPNNTDSTMLLLTAFDKRLAAMEAAMSAVTGVTNNLVSTYAVFEYKYDQAKRVSDKLEGLVDTLKSRNEDELRRTMDLIDDGERRLEESILLHKGNVLREVELRNTALKDQLIALEKKLEETNTTLEDIKKWVWIVMGGAATLSFLAEKIFQLFGS